jgi:hypothetical protein
MKTISILKKIFEARKITIATMHQKERIIAPLLKDNLGVIPVTVEDFNTDTYGTFTGEIKRYGKQLEAAQKKAYAAMDLANTDLAVASEGSFGPHPSIPFIQSNLELIIFVDKKYGLEIRGHYRTEDTNMAGQYIKDVTEALAFANKVGFPEHGVIVRKSKDSKFGIHKNITTEKELVDVVNKMLGGLFTKQIYIETDMRAHKNPTRMKAIEQATLDLIKNIQSICPKCETPGFAITDVKEGLRCSSCSLPTQLPMYEIYVCKKCNHEHTEPVKKYGEFADPMYCDYCNP